MLYYFLFHRMKGWFQTRIYVEGTSCARLNPIEACGSANRLGVSSPSRGPVLGWSGREGRVGLRGELVN